jgi:rhodanese-related sulfurtransferase
MSLYDKSVPAPGGIRDISPADVKAAAGSVRIVDVREPSEFNDQLGHIAGAELVPLATVAGAAQSWDRDAELVLVCRSGGRSGRAAAGLAQLGFKRVMNMTGGMMAWNAAGFPVERK